MGYREREARQPTRADSCNMSACLATRNCVAGRVGLGGLGLSRLEPLTRLPTGPLGAVGRDINHDPS